MMINSYAWRLEAAVWTKQRNGDDEVRCRPRLLLVNRSWGHEEAHEYGVIGFIEYDVGGRTEGPAFWLVYHYLKNAEGLWEHLDETSYGYRHVLGEGERRDPRPSAQAALAHLLKLTVDDIPKPEHGALVKTVASFLPALQALTDAYVRQRAPSKGKTS